MEGQYHISDPRLVASLPRPFDQITGRTHFGPGYTAKTSKKRKRSEIAIGADGESITIYSIKSLRALTKHPLPPRTFLNTAPYFIHKSPSRDFEGFRVTYGSTRNDLSSCKHEIVAYREDLPKSIPGRSPAIANITESKRDLGSDENPVVYIAPILQDEDSELLILQKDGDVNIFSQDLRKRLNDTYLRRKHPKLDDTESERMSVIEYACLENAQNFVKGVLKDRLDILSLLKQVSHAGDDSIASTEILAVVKSCPMRNKTSHRYFFEMWMIRTKNTVPDTRSRIQYLTSWKIPPIQDALVTPKSFSFDTNSGILQHLSATTLHLYDLTGPLIRKLQPFQQLNQPILSALKFNDSWWLSGQNGEIGMYDQQYQCLQTIWSPQRTDSVSQSRKRRYTDSEPVDGPVTLLDFNPSLSTLLAVSESKLIKFDVKIPRKRLRTELEPPGRLIDAIGRNFNSPEQGLRTTGKWSKVFERLDQFAEKQDLKSYEELWSESIQDDDFLLEMLVTRTISHVFTMANPPSNSTSTSFLKIRFLPEQVYNTLLVTGRLTPQRIYRSLQLSNPSILLDPDYLKWTLLMRTIQDHDTTLLLLSDFVELSPQIPLDGLIYALGIFLRSFDSESISAQQQSNLSALPTPSTPGTPRTPSGQYTNGFSFHSKTNSVVSEALSQEADDNALVLAEHDLEHASTLLESGLEHRSNALRVLLNRLALSYTQSTTLSSALRTHLPRRDIELFIELLRGELARGGWDDHILNHAPQMRDDVSTCETSNPPDEPLTPVCTLLNAAVDALGIAGWLTDYSSSLSSNDKLIPSLRASTSSVLESIQEATFLSGFLHDFLRYSNTQAKKGQARVGTVSTLPSINDEETAAMLPLGMHKKTSVSDTKVNINGVIRKRSRREIAYRKSKSIGKYSFERIDI